jgi:hypothetical protein
MGRYKGIILAVLALVFAVAASASAERTADFEKLLAWYKAHYDFTEPDDSIYTFEGEYGLPEGFHVPDSSEMSGFSLWVQNFPIWHQWKAVGQWDGGKAFEFNQVSRVVHLPWTGSSFTDRAIPVRILGEYLRYTHHQFDMTIIPPAGKSLSYRDWLSGKPAYNSHMELFLKPGDKRDSSDAEYYQYLTFVMSGITYHSLPENCDPISADEIMPGDLYLAYDTTADSGQVYVVMHVVQNDRGDKRYIVATGCRKACDFYIPIVNPNRDDPWVTTEDIASLNAGHQVSGFFRLRLIENRK